MKVKFKFQLNVVIDDYEVEAESYEDALKKLYATDVKDLIEDGYIDESDIQDEDGEIIEKTVKVKVYDIEYDIDREDFETEDEYLDAVEKLPKEATYEVDVKDDDDIYDAILDKILLETDLEANRFRYTVVEEK